jgi:hypothetical protein
VVTQPLLETRQPVALGEYYYKPSRPTALISRGQFSYTI